MAKSYFIFLLILMASPVIVFVLHVALVRILRKLIPELAPLPVAAFTCFAGLVPAGVLLWSFHLCALSAAELLWPILYAGIVYACLAFCYFILFTMSETARRIHILRKLYERGAVLAAELAAEYNAEDMLSVRLGRMVALRQLSQKDGRYFLQARLMWGSAILLSVWAGLLGFKKKEIV